MAYGIEILTTSGVIDVADLATASIVATVVSATVSGSVVVSEFSEDRGDFIFVMDESKSKWPHVVWTESTKTLSWSNTTPAPDSAFGKKFTVYFFEDT